MSAPSTTVTPLASYRNETPYPFCPGCGHGPILDHLNEALVQLQLDPQRVVLVSDIGCSGLSDQYFETSAFHGLHGRSITYATGIKLARPELTVIVIMGDGGTGIGGAHLIAAARRNVGITVLVFNNMNFGMTGGQHSTTTPRGSLTSTTPGGNLERPLDICATVAANGAGFVYRGTSFDADLADRIAEGIRHDGFALLDIWELCTAYFVPRNKLTKKALFETLDELQFPTGVLQRRDTPEYTTTYRAAHAAMERQSQFESQPVVQRFTATLDRRFCLVLAGSAGGRVGSSAGLAAQAALLSGLYAAQRNDYAVTVKTGHSVSELILGPHPIEYAGVARPDALLILSADGRRKADRYLRAMNTGDRVFALSGYTVPDTRARVSIIDPARSPTRIPQAQLALAVLTAALHRLSLFPDEALEEAIRQGPADHVGTNLKAFEAGLALAAD